MFCSVSILPYSGHSLRSASRGSCMCCNVLQCGAGCYSVLQCVAVCCSADIIP